MDTLQQTYNEVKKKSVQIIANYPDSMVYHDIKFATRFESYVDKIGKHVDLPETDILLGKIGSWIISASFAEVKHIIKGHVYSNNLADKSLAQLNNFVSADKIGADHLTMLQTGISEIKLPTNPKTIIGKLLVDGITSDIALQDGGKKRLKKFHEELLLKDVTISNKKWYDVAINIAQNLHFYFDYCKDEFQPEFDSLILDLQKDKKRLEKSNDLALKKELDISDSELKELKKNLRDVKGRDARGIQTVFRTMSKNHYTLNEMVDKKASIMITVNSIILSLVLGGIFGNGSNADQDNLLILSLPVILLTLGSAGSIFFAILSTRPDSTHGHFTEDQIRDKKGNLLFYGNFHNMKERDFQWAFLQMVNDQEYMYESMVRDLYYIGQVLKRKFAYIRKSLNIFMIGLAASILSKMACSLLTHLGF